MLWLLIAGVLLWSLVHLFPSLMPAKREALVDSLGNKYQGLFALLILLSLVLIVTGWRNTVPEPVYTPPSGGRHLTMLLVLFAVILFGASHAKSWLKQNIRHPMLSGMAVWGIAHLLANGDIRSVVLFGGMTLWATLSIYFINRRDGDWAKPEMTVTLLDNVKLIVISLVVYVALLFLHPYFAGIPVMAA